MKKMTKTTKYSDKIESFYEYTKTQHVEKCKIGRENNNDEKKHDKNIRNTVRGINENNL